MSAERLTEGVGRLLQRGLRHLPQGEIGSERPTPATSPLRGRCQGAELTEGVGRLYTPQGGDPAGGQPQTPLRGRGQADRGGPLTNISP